MKNPNIHRRRCILIKKLLAVILIVLFGSVGLAYGQSAKDTYKALKKVEARVETGVTYKDYPQVISDAKAEVNIFLEGKDAKKNPQLAEHIKKAMDYYTTAGKIWSIKFALSSGTLDTPGTDNEYGRAIKRLYPKAKAEMSPSGEGQSYVISNVLSQIWVDASKEIKKASEYLK